MGSNPALPPQRGQYAERVQAYRSRAKPRPCCLGWVHAVPSDRGARGQLSSIRHHDLSRREAGPLPERKQSRGRSGLGPRGLCSAQQAQPGEKGVGEGPAGRPRTAHPEKPASALQCLETSRRPCALHSCFPQGLPAPMGAQAGTPGPWPPAGWVWLTPPRPCLQRGWTPRPRAPGALLVRLLHPPTPRGPPRSGPQGAGVTCGWGGFLTCSLGRRAVATACPTASPRSLRAGPGASCSPSDRLFLAWSSARPLATFRCVLRAAGPPAAAFLPP